MTAFVFNDADYFFPQLHYQVEGVLGYPALSALGSLTITNEDMIEVRPAKQRRLNPHKLRKMTSKTIPNPAHPFISMAKES